jgi:hypothetical protein
MAKYMAKQVPPRPIDETTAARIMARIREGDTLTRICGARIGKSYLPELRLASRDQFRRYCSRHPDFEAEALILLARNAETARAAKGLLKRSMTHCKRGHPLTPDNIYLRQQGDYSHRSCKICLRHHADNRRDPTPKELQLVTAALNRGKKISEICFGVRGAKKVAVKIINFDILKQYRLKDPSFDRFVRQSFSGGRSKRTAYWSASSQSGAVVAVSERNDYYAIREMLPANLPSDDKDEIVSNIVVAMCEGSLRRDHVFLRIREFVAAHQREQRNGVGKYGLISLDAPVSMTSTLRRIDTISRGT